MERPLFREGELSTLSPEGQLVMATSIITCAAAKLEREVDLDNLLFHCERVVAAMVGAAPAEKARLATFAPRRLRLAQAAQDFVQAYRSCR